MELIAHKDRVSQTREDVWKNAERDENLKSERNTHTENYLLKFLHFPLDKVILRFNNLLLE